MADEDLPSLAVNPESATVGVGGTDHSVEQVPGAHQAESLPPGPPDAPAAGGRTAARPRAADRASSDQSPFAWRPPGCSRDPWEHEPADDTALARPPASPGPSIRHEA